MILRAEINVGWGEDHALGEDDLNTNPLLSLRDNAQLKFAVFL